MATPPRFPRGGPRRDDAEGSDSGGPPALEQWPPPWDPGGAPPTTATTTTTGAAATFDERQLQSEPSRRTLSFGAIQEASVVGSYGGLDGLTPGRRRHIRHWQQYRLT